MSILQLIAKIVTPNFTNLSEILSRCLLRRSQLPMPYQRSDVAGRQGYNCVVVAI